jgi:spore coat polysaccharide biosynthesis predicted glycosyltransferase SpsG
MVLFRVAAGPRIGHGHLRRAEVLARTLGWPACISVRGSGAHSVLPLALHAGAAATLDAVRPSVLVIDDPHSDHGQVWVRAAARRRIPTVSLHDLGLARVPSTIAIDGSVVSPATGWPAARVLRGLEYAVIAAPARRRAAGDVRRVLVSLGGGPRVGLTRAIVHELRRRHPQVEFLVTQAMAADARGVAPRRVRVVRATSGLTPWFGRVDVAVVGGGVSLYEAVAAGVSTVAVPVVPAQRPTIRGFEQLQLTVGGVAANVSARRVVTQVASRFDALVANTAWRRRVTRLGPSLIDGRGARRVARAIAAISQGVERA